MTPDQLLFGVRSFTSTLWQESSGVGGVNLSVVEYLCRPYLSRRGTTSKPVSVLWVVALPPVLPSYINLIASLKTSRRRVMVSFTEALGLSLST